MNRIWMLVAAGAVMTSRAATHEVSPGGDLLAAVAASQAGDEIIVNPGIYELSQTVMLSDAITVRGVTGNPADVTLDFGARCRGFKLAAEGATVSSLTITGGKASGGADGDHGGGILIKSNGLVENCVISNCLTEGKSTGGSGGGVALDGGGVVSGCEITACKARNLYAKGNAVICMNGGVVTNCSIHANDGGYSHTELRYGSGVVYLWNGGTLVDSRVFDNEKDTVPGVVQMDGGTVANCLIYGNRGKNAASGLWKNKGETAFCTIAGNTGADGLHQEGGATQNCIVYGNGTQAEPYVTGGSLENCVTTRDPLFMNAENHDYRIRAGASPAVRKAVPLEAYPKDIEGRERGEKPTIGCYEFSGGAAGFGVDLVSARSKYAHGENVEMTAAVTGEENVTYVWSVNDVLQTDETAATLVLANLPFGLYRVKVAVTRISDSTVVEAESEIGICPTVCYVSPNGTDEYPYATPETAAKTLRATMSAVLTDGATVPEIVLGEGEYASEGLIELKTPFVIRGAGMDNTIIAGSNDVGLNEHEKSVFALRNAQCTISDLTVRGGKCRAFEVEKGLVRNCRVREIKANVNYLKSAAFYVQGGRVENCEAVDCVSSGVQANGTGLYLEKHADKTKGVVSNLTVRGCSVGPGNGGGVYLNDGTIVDSTVGDCSCSEGSGGSVWADWGVIERCSFTNTQMGGKSIGCAVRLGAVTARNSLFATSRVASGATGVLVEKMYGYGFATIENCTFAGHRGGSDAVKMTGATIRNTIIAENDGAETFDGCTVTHSRTESAVDGEGNITGDPVFRNAASGDFRLRAGSPCENGGMNLDWMGEASIDLLGNPRVRHRLPDMGCYEATSRVGTIVRIR